MQASKAKQSYGKQSAMLSVVQCEERVRENLRNVESSFYTWHLIPGAHAQLIEYEKSCLCYFIRKNARSMRTAELSYLCNVFNFFCCCLDCCTISSSKLHFFHSFSLLSSVCFLIELYLFFRGKIFFSSQCRIIFFFCSVVALFVCVNWYDFGKEQCIACARSNITSVPKRRERIFFFYQNRDIPILIHCQLYFKSIYSLYDSPNAYLLSHSSPLLLLPSSWHRIFRCSALYSHFRLFSR